MVGQEVIVAIKMRGIPSCGRRVTKLSESLSLRRLMASGSSVEFEGWSNESQPIHPEGPCAAQSPCSGSSMALFRKQGQSSFKSAV